MRNEKIDVRLSPTEAKKLRAVAAASKRSRSDTMRYLMLEAYDRLSGTEPHGLQAEVKP